MKAEVKLTKVEGRRTEGIHVASRGLGAFRFLFLAFCLLPSTFCLLPSAFCLPPPSPAPASNNANARQTYDAFRLVHTRNVFDPDRRPVRPANASAPAPAPTRADYVALTGIASDGDRTLAFFSGSRAEFNAVVSADGKVAGATVTKINPMNVEVNRNGRHLVVNVGQTVPLDDKSLPGSAPSAPADQPPAAANPPPGISPPAGPAAQAQPAPGAPASSANLDDIRRRMMERHNQDQK